MNPKLEVPEFEQRQHGTVDDYPDEDFSDVVRVRPGSEKAWERPAAPSAIEALRSEIVDPETEPALSEAKADILKRLQREQAAVKTAQGAVDDALDWREGRLVVSVERKRIQATLREWWEECDRNIKVFNRANGLGD